MSSNGDEVWSEGSGATEPATETATDEIVTSERAGSYTEAIRLSDVLTAMGKTYRDDPEGAVLGQVS